MMIDDDEASNEESHDEPTITVVNYEIEMQLVDNSHNQDSVPDGSFNEDGNQLSIGQAMLDEQENNTQDSIEPSQAGPSIVSNSNSTLTRRSTRASTAKKVNYSEAMGNSLPDQPSPLTGTRKRKRPIGRSGKSNALKRSRNRTARTVSVEETDESEDEEEDDPESEAISFRVIVRRLNCRVQGCKEVFPGKAQLIGHLLVKHAIEKYACKVKNCTESYATIDELTTHRNSAHDNLDNDWPGGQCEVTCNNYHDLCTHTNYYHEYGQFACSADKCDFTEKTRIKVHNHQRKHGPAKYRCTYPGCSSSFNKKSNLTRHLLVHSKEKPFLCSQCPKAFAEKSSLTRHERIHSGLKPYSCTWPQCDFSASRQSTVIVPIRAVHFGLPVTMKKQREKSIIDNRDARLFLKKSLTTDVN